MWVKREENNCFLYGTTESLFNFPLAIWTSFVWLLEPGTPTERLLEVSIWHWDQK